MKIKKKIWPEYFDAVRSGKKRFELRLADFNCQEGDVLLLQEWDPKTKKYTGREIKKAVTFVTRTRELNFWSKKEVDKYGYQVIGIK